MLLQLRALHDNAWLSGQEGCDRPCGEKSAALIEATWLGTKSKYQMLGQDAVHRPTSLQLNHVRIPSPQSIGHPQHDVIAVTHMDVNQQKRKSKQSQTVLSIP